MSVYVIYSHASTVKLSLESLMDLWRKLHQDAGLASDALPRHVTTTQTFQIGKHSIPGVDQVCNPNFHE